MDAEKIKALMANSHQWGLLSPSFNIREHFAKKKEQYEAKKKEAEKSKNIVAPTSAAATAAAGKSFVPSVGAVDPDASPAPQQNQN